NRFCLARSALGGAHRQFAITWIRASVPSLSGPKPSRTQEPNGRQLTRLLRARRERPCRRAAEQGDERPTFHSITSSARVSIVAGTSRLTALAALILITSSNRVGCTTGKSAGLAPSRMRPIYAPI